MNAAGDAIMGRVTPAGQVRVTAAATAAAVTISALAAVVQLWATVADRQSLGAAACVNAAFLAFAVVGAVVAAARPANRIGWLMLVGAVLSSMGNAGAALAHHGIVVAPGSLPVPSAVAVAGQSCRSLGWGTLTLVVPAVFPDGTLPRPGWRWLRRLLGAVLVASVLAPALDRQADLDGLGSWQNPLAPHGNWQIFSGLAFVVQGPLGLVAGCGVVALLISRWRHGEALVRQQLLLLLLAVALGVLAVPLVFVAGFAAGPWVFGVTGLALPVAIGFAVLARDLYDLRTAANRTLVWGTLSLCIAGTYALAVAGIGNRVGAGHASWLPWAAAAVVAIVFAPLRDALQRAANRLTFGRWEQPYALLAALGQQLEASADVTRLLDRVVDELRSLDLADVGIRDADGVLLAGADPPHGAHELPLTAYGRAVGVLTFTVPPARLRHRDHQLLDDLAGHLGGVLHAHALTAELQRSRERLVLAREEERRRLRRDLHDGLGPSLAGHLLRLDLLAKALPAGSPARLDAEALRTDLAGTMADVRRVVEGLRPPAVDELGLAGAIGQVIGRLTAATAIDVRLELEVPAALPAAVEVAAFRIVGEAVTNVVRHAGATHCLVRVAPGDGGLVLDVVDDGRGCRGLGSARGGDGTGHGLSTMRERAEELGGTLTVSARQGTRVHAELPLPALPAQVGPGSPTSAAPPPVAALGRTAR